MTAPPRICVVGSANVDLTFRTPRLPQAGETLTAHQLHQGWGGKGANQAVTAVRLGAHVHLVACLGNDAFGHESLRHYRAVGLDTTHVRQDAARPTGVAAIVVDDGARNSILIASGANGALAPRDIHAAAPAIRQASVLLCQLEVPRETTWEALRIAKAAGVRTVLNPAPAAALPAELLSLCDLCIPNETEAEQLSGRPADTVAGAEEAAQTLRARGARAVIVTRGEHGALLIDDRGTSHAAPFQVAAVDTTGAGDAFTAGVAVFWAEGLPLPEAARRASAVAALTVTRPGTQTAFPSRSEVEAFLAHDSGSVSLEPLTPA